MKQLTLDASQYALEKKWNCLIWLTALCALFVVSSTIWFALDHSWPYWDAAGHLQDATKYAALWHRFHPFSLSWINQFLTVSFYYPPTVHAFNGLLKSLLGQGRWVDDLSLILFGLILNVSVFILARILLEDVLVAILAVLLINFYPLVSVFSHMSMLDFPYLALYSFSLATLVWWHKKPGYTHATLAGVAMALAVTSKQSAAIFLAAPCLILALDCLKNRYWHKLWQLVLIGLLSISAWLLWMIPNLGSIKTLFKEYSQVIVQQQSLWQVFLTNLQTYIYALPRVMSPLMLLLFFIACCFTSSATYKKLWIPVLGSISGVLILSTSAYNVPEYRYIITVLLATTLISAIYLARLIRSSTKWACITALSIILLASIQFLLLNFSPYPLYLSPKTIRLLTTLSDQAVNSNMEVSLHPTPPGDPWGQEWLINTIGKVQENKHCWVNTVPSTSKFNVHTLELALLYHPAPINFSTIRRWTPKGDQIFIIDNLIASHTFQWFVLKTGDQGYSLYDQVSINNYSHAIDQIKHDYFLYAKRKLPDNSTLLLYRAN